MRLLYLFFTLLPLFAMGQDCTIEQYQKLLKDADAASQKGQYDLAINKLQSAKTCRPEKEAEVSAAILKVFKKVNGERDKAEKNLAKSKKLIHHFNFNKEHAAWAYKNGKFAVIDLNGDTLTDFIYEDPEVFSNGNAIAIHKSQSVIINEYGKEISPHYSYLIRAENKTYYAGRYDGNDILDSNKNILYFCPNSIFAREYNDKVNDNYLSKSKKYKIAQKGNYFGVIDSLGCKVVDFKYEYVRFFSDKFFSVRNGDKWGVLNSQGDTILDIAFDEIVFISNDMFGVEKNKKWAVFDNKGRLFIDYKYDWMGEVSDGLLQVRKNKKNGYLDLTGMEIIPMVYDYIDSFSEGLAWATSGKERVCIRNTGQVLFVLKGDYNAVRPFHNGFSSIRKHDKWGLIDKKGNEVIAPISLSPIIVDNGLAVLNRDNTCSIVDTTGQIKCNKRYQYLSRTQDGFFMAKNDGKWGALNPQGKEVVPVEYENVLLNHDKYFFLKTQGGWSIKRKDGRRCSSAIFSQINTFPNGEVFVQTRYGWELLDTLLNQVSLQKLLYISEFVKNGLAEAQRNDKWGYIDSLGRTKIPFDCDSSSTYFQDLFAMCGNLGAYDKNIRHETRAFLEPVINGLQRSIIRFKYGILDPDGKIVLPFEYSEIYPCGYHVFLTEQNGLIGLFAPDLGINIDPGYSQFGFLDEEFGWIRVQKNGKWGWIDRNGVEMIPIRYEIIMPFKEGKALVRQSPYPGFFYINKLGEMILSSP